MTTTFGADFNRVINTISTIRIDTLLSKVIPNQFVQSQTQRFILFKNTEPFSFDQLNPTIQHVELFHCKTAPTLSIPNHISVLNIVHLEELQRIEGLESNQILRTFAISWCKKLSNVSAIASDRLESIKIHWCQRLEQIPSLKQQTLKSGYPSLSITKEATRHLLVQMSKIRFCWFSEHYHPFISRLSKLRF